MSANGIDRGDASSRGGRCPAWLTIALVLSLGANLLVGGIYIGERLRSAEEAAARQPFAERIASYLPEARRSEVIAFLNEGSQDPEARFVAISDATRAAAETLTAEPFDPDALDAALARRMQVFAARFERRQDRLVDLAAMLTPQERALLAEGLTARNEAWIARRRAKESR
ncbi:MAG: periplasmic heavy metal sensor [Pikeienuella sp.]